MSSTYNFKKIQIVPNSSDFLDIILSKTQRKTPTVVHKSYAIGRIRQFYMRKVKFTQENFDEKLNAILHEFPILDSIHPFYADLMNILYDKDHYKLALGQINTAKHLINAVSKDYVKLLKFGDSLYRCKQLKKAALGRMATIMKRQKDSLAYLEQVRQHLSRLPSIDPNTRTLLLCGYPNVGKSSFINKITRADVDVQPYAFTTKSLFVGHMDYKYLRWQVIDTPGILDHPLEDRNTIEMQSITALAHLRACVLFFLDLSEQCGYTIEDQCALFNSIKPLFHNKPTLLVINKIDVKKLSDLSPSHRDYIDSLTNNSDVQLAQLSCFTDEGVMDVRNMACDKLLAARVEMKLKSQKVHDILNKLHLAQPQIRDDLPRLPFIPEGFLNKRLSSSNPDNKPKLERDHEAENGGAGVYNIDLKSNIDEKYMLEDSEWKYDKIPEIMNGKNVADFIDPEIEAKLEALEREEENLVNQGFYELDDNMENSEDEAIRSAASQIRAKKQVVQQLNRLKKGKNRAVLARKIIAQKSTSKELADHLSTLGLEANAAIQTATKKSQKRARSNSCGIDIARHSTSYPTAETDRSISRVRDRNELGLKDMKAKEFVESISRKAQRTNNLLAKRGEADRQIQVKRPKHLFAGKRKSGKTDRR